MSTPTPEALLTHATWVRGLARSLVRDDQAADDLVQEAWLAALTKPPRTLSRGWLGSVVRNAARSRWRRETRLAARERTAARPEITRSTDALAAEAEWQRRIVAAVLALEAPYRDVLLLHYFDDLSPTETAKRQGEPAGTVRSRLKRAHDMLRARFDRDHGGDRRAWTLALVPLASRRASATSTLPTAWIAAALVACIAFVTWQSFAALERPSAPTRAGDEHVASVRNDAATEPSPPHPLNSLVGVVLGQGEQPLAEAAIRVGDTTTYSAEDGSFRARVTQGEPFHLTVTAPGYAPHVLRATISSDRAGLAIQLLPAAEFRVRILDIDGRPIPDAVVRLCERGGEFRAASHSGADGSARISDVRADWYTLFVTHPQYAPASRGVRAPSHALTMRLERGATLEGVTLDRRTRAPVEGVRVRVLLPGGETALPDGPTLEALSDSRGRFRLDRIPTTRGFDVDVDAGPRGRLKRRWLAVQHLPLLQTILLDEERSIQGVARGPDGAPVSGLTLRPWDTLRPRDHLVTTDALGRFTVSGRAPLGRAISVVSNHWKLARLDRGNEFTLHVTPHQTLTGRAIDSSGSPVFGAVVTSELATTITDANGKYAVSGQNVEIAQSGYRTAYTQGGEVTLAPRSGWTMTGSVTDEAGSPLAGVLIQCNHKYDHGLGGAHYATTWADGSFTVRGLEPGRQRILARLPGYRGAQQYVATRDPVALTLDHGQTLRGEVVDRNGDPVPGAGIHVSKFMLMTRPAPVQTDSRGRFAVQGAESGGVTVEVYVFGRRVARLQPVLPLKEPLRIIVDRGASIEGVVLRSDGAPVAHASIRTKDLYAPVGFDGRFRLDGLDKDKSYELRARDTRARSDLEAFEVFPVIVAKAGEQGVVIRAYRGGEITGTLVGAKDEPIAGVRLRLDPKAGKTIRSDAAGRFRIVGIPQGSYRVRITDGRYYLPDSPAIAANGEAVTLRAKKTRSITGRVLGTRPKNCSVSAKREDDQSVQRYATVADDGGFELRNLRPGVWLLNVVAPGASNPSAQPVEAGATGVELTFD